MEGILEQIISEGAWEQFLAHRLIKGRFSWRSFEEADEFVEKRQYLPLASRIAGGEGLGIPERVVVNKMGTGKKRVVYHFGPDGMRILKLIAHLLYRYDGVFAPNCYAFRRGIRAGDAIRHLNNSLNGRQMWAYKVDIHNYFNSISIPMLLPILSSLLADDPALFRFFEGLLDDDRAYSGDVLVHEQRGVMAGLPTASFLANVYLMEVDRHFHDAGVIYARYSDDIILFAEDRETLDRYRATLLGFFDKYRLEVNPSKEFIYAPGEPFEFLGFRCSGREIDISKATRDKLKGKIRRKARSLRRWCTREGKEPEKAVSALIRSFNRKLFDMEDDEGLCWASWFFPVINRTEGLQEIDRYLQENCRYIATGRHSKANYRLRYADLKRLGYRSLQHEYYSITSTAPVQSS
ncbi:MAG: hypothetical protein K6E37_04265 [Bacteroidales bacterium]|nr:hypothetical protein [Bacteroidales bacterium]